MKWIKKLFGVKEQEEEKSLDEIIEILDTREVLKDSNGENLICNLCENWDNEFNKYYPIYEGEKITFMGKVWHKSCLRAFRKESRRGN